MTHTGHDGTRSITTEVGNDLEKCWAYTEQKNVSVQAFQSYNKKLMTHAKKPVHTRAGISPEKTLDQNALFSCRRTIPGMSLCKLSGSTNS